MLKTTNRALDILIVLATVFLFTSSATVAGVPVMSINNTEIISDAMSSGGGVSLSIDNYNLTYTLGQPAGVKTSSVDTLDLQGGVFNPYQTVASTEAIPTVELLYEYATLMGGATQVYINIVDTTTTGATVAISSAADAGLGVFSNLYDIQPDSVTFTPPAILTFHYDQALLDSYGVIESSVNVYRFAPSIGWQLIPAIERNSTEDWLKIQISSTSIYAILASLPDTTSPVTEINLIGDYYVSVDTKTYISPHSSFTLTAIDPIVSGFNSGVRYTEYKIDGNPWKVYAGTVTIGLEISEEELEGEHTIQYHSVDNAGNEEEIKEKTVLMDIKPPGKWVNFTPANWVLDWTPDCSIEVADLVSGLDVTSAEYRYSIDTGQTWSEWINAGCTGINGSTETQTITAIDVPFNQASIDKNKIKFKISDMVSNVGVSPAYTVKTMLPAVVDIDPNTLNLKSRGRWITCYIEFPNGYDINDTNLSTLNISKINDEHITPIFAEAAPTNIGDHDMDGIPDLMVKFNRSAVQNIVEPAEQVKLTIEGFLKNGTKLIGEDSIRVINPPEAKPSDLSAKASYSDENSNPEKIKTNNANANKPDKQEKINQGKHIGNQAKNQDKGLFPKKLKFKNGHKWVKGPKDILNTNGKYPNWRNKWKNENKKRNQKFKLGWAEKKEVKINKLMDQPEISVTCLAVYDAETGELVWHSNFGNHHGQIMDMREKYKKNPKMNGLLKIHPGKGKGLVKEHPGKSKDKEEHSNQGKGQDKDKGKPDDESGEENNNGNGKGNDKLEDKSNNGKGQDKGKGKGKDK